MFGTDVGKRVTSVRTAWIGACRKAGLGDHATESVAHALHTNANRAQAFVADPADDKSDKFLVS
jgi:hypothetical protein